MTFSLRLMVDYMFSYVKAGLSPMLGKRNQVSSACGGLDGLKFDLGGDGADEVVADGNFADHSAETRTVPSRDTEFLFHLEDEIGASLGDGAFHWTPGGDGHDDECETP